MKNIFLLFLAIIVSLLSCKLFQSNASPSASFIINPTSGTVNTVFSFDASSSTDDEDSLEDLHVRWDWEYDGIYDTDWETIKTATHQYNSIGNHTVHMQVKDSEGGTDRTSNSLSISNTAPAAFFTVSPNNGNTSTEFTFDASSSTDDEDSLEDLQVRWDWESDGNWDEDFSHSKVFTKQFDSASNYTVTLEVVDRGGLKDTISIAVDVSLECGALIKDDYTLIEDINCMAYDSRALEIYTSNVTFDLGGYTITNNSKNREKIGLEIHDANNVTIKNGAIEGFITAIDVRNCNNIKIENVDIKNMNITNLDTFVFGINATQSNDVTIENCYFEFPKVGHKEAVISYESSINVNNIELNGGSCGVNFSYGYTCLPGSRNCNNGGIVTNCTFKDVVFSGVLVACSNNTLLQGNEFINNNTGVQVYGPNLGSITNLIVDDNYIHDCIVGIHFMGVTESTISNNIIQNNDEGISLDQCHECGRLGNFINGCFYSTDNSILNNTVTGNTLDLWHFEQCTGNTWLNNTCQTKEGDEIPYCTD